MRRAVLGRGGRGRWLLAALLAVGLALGVAESPADEAAGAATVRGTIPDLSGRSLVVVWLDVKGQGTRTNPALWQIARDAERLTVKVRYVTLPKEQQDRLEEANRTRKAWQPSPADVAAVAAGWDTLEPRPNAPKEVTTTIVGHDGFDATLTEDPRMRDALFVVQQIQGGDTGAGPVMQQTQLLAAMARRPEGGYTGNSTTAVSAAAPFPISVTFDGTFALYPLDRPSGFLARLLDLFSGCRR